MFALRNETIMLQQLPPTLPNLLKEFGREAKTFIREEIQLFTTEMKEKFSEWSGDGGLLGIGAAAAYVGFIVLLFAFSLLATFGFQRMDIDYSAAMAAGFGAIGLVTIIIGVLMLMSAIKAFSRESLNPERAIANLYKVRGEPVPIKQAPSKSEQRPKPRSHDLEKTVMATEDRLGRTFEELERRLTLSGVRRRLVERARLHPYRCGTLALLAGFAASFLVIRRLRI
jgi:Putative Actinobacterial Holin-X, holin superfamily III